MKTIPVNMITGFLGSGKTTAIIKLLNEHKPGENWAVIINEFGTISIDGQTIRSRSQASKVHEISGGCICCSAQLNFRENLEKIALSGKFDRIIIEPSGLGGAEMIAGIIASIVHLKLMPTICMVDVLGLGNQRLKRNMIYRSQIHSSDVIVFSKCDLLKGEFEPEKTISKFDGILQPGKTRILHTDLTEEFLHSMEESPQTKGRMEPICTLDVSDANYRQFQFVFDQKDCFKIDSLHAFLSEFQEILRAKGHIRTKQGWRLINLSSSGFQHAASEPKTQNELIVIGKKSANLNREHIRESLLRLMHSGAH